ncbi:hypothetical protein AVEN_39893-1 [Araneus ventricosus]|uniref:Uncharacterized protein n=1 Tax=Araneus ventricosus TaxID=182803 RepID=A0A4Y2JSU4_ARAVE|nr:hypothetical protein AVEN_39893-1 [Araneus ventricosus]
MINKSHASADEENQLKGSNSVQARWLSSSVLPQRLVPHWCGLAYAACILSVSVWSEIDETRRDLWSTARCKAAETSSRLKNTITQKALGFFKSGDNLNLRSKEQSEVLLRCCQSVEVWSEMEKALLYTLG